MTIHIYGSRDNNYESNGYAILQPISCTIKQEKNGLYEAELETDIDEYGKFKYLECNCVLKLPILYHGEFTYQLFRIYATKRKMGSDGTYRITANARHIFYDLNNKLLLDCRPTTLNGNDAISWIMSHFFAEQNNIFEYHSDITRYSTAYYQNMSVTSALLGADNAFINRWGGALYRDNFYFSICRDTEYYQDSGTIRYGYNMIDIEFTADYSDCVTYLLATDNYGNTRSFYDNDVPNTQFPQHCYKSVDFSYDEPNRDIFLEDAQAYFDNYNQATVNVKVTFADLSDTDLYADFLRLADYEVGDKVTIYHKDLNINYSNLEIISKTYDVVSHQTSEIEIGNFKNAISRTNFMADTTTNNDSLISNIENRLDNVTFETFVTTPITTIIGEYLKTADSEYLLFQEG